MIRQYLNFLLLNYLNKNLLNFINTHCNNSMNGQIQLLKMEFLRQKGYFN